MSSIGGVSASANHFFVEANANLQNKSSPAQKASSSYSRYSYDNTGQSADFLATFKSRLQKFQYSLSSNSFLADAFSWRIKTAGVADRNRLLVKASTSAAETDYSVKIDRLADSRKAVSKRINSNDVTEFDSGTYSFDLTIGETTYSLDVEIDKTVTNPDTNKDVWRKIQAAIDGKDVSIEAFINEKKVKDYSQYTANSFKRVSSLTVQNKSTGTESNFTLQDTSGDLIDKLGLDKIRSSGSTSQYAVNAESGSTNSNSVALNNDLQAQFFSTTNEKPLNLRVRGAKADLEKALINTIADYNDLMEWLDDKRRFISSTVKNDIFQKIGSSILNRNNLQNKEGLAVTQGNLSSTLQVTNRESTERELAEIGLQLTNDGRLNINDDFAAALQKDLKAVHGVLAGDDGFFSKVGQAVADILNQSGEKYILQQSNFLAYNSNGTQTKDIYLRGSSQLVNLYA